NPPVVAGSVVGPAPVSGPVSGTGPVPVASVSPAPASSGALVPVSRPVPDRRIVTTAKGKQFVAVPRKPRRSGPNWLVVPCAVVAVLLAGGVITLYATRPHPAPTKPATVGTPDSAVREFLSAVFLGDDASRLASVVCSTWTPADALARTKSMVDSQAKVSW